MAIVWMVFVFTAILLAVGAWRAMRSRNEHASAFRSIGRFLLVMALGTAFFPALLPHVGVKAWVTDYIAFVILLTGIMTARAVGKARQFG